MNIDIVNRQVSNKLKIKESKVALVNKFYWRSIYDYFYSYNEKPLNIDNICVFYDDKWLVKKYIKYLINKIRKTKVSPKFRENSPIREKYIERYKEILKSLWALRKIHKYIN